MIAFSESADFTPDLEMESSDEITNFQDEIEKLAENKKLSLMGIEKKFLGLEDKERWDRYKLLLSLRAADADQIISTADGFRLEIKLVESKDPKVESQNMLRSFIRNRSTVIKIEAEGYISKAIPEQEFEVYMQDREDEIKVV